MVYCTAKKGRNRQRWGGPVSITLVVVICQLLMNVQWMVFQQQQQQQACAPTALEQPSQAPPINETTTKTTIESTTTTESPPLPPKESPQTPPETRKNKEQNASQEVIWSWYFYSSAHTPSLNRNTTTDGSTGTSPRILIAQSAGVDAGHRKMLSVTGRVNRAYARKYGCDYAALEGVVLGGFKHWHATFAKVEVLHVALKRGTYDAAFILDVDALIVDFDVDVASLYDPKYALLAQRVAQEEHAWNLNIGVALWNLRHGNTPWLSARWRNFSQETLASKNPLFDQGALHIILRDEMTPEERNTTVHTVDKIFQYSQGTFVKHFIRGHTFWNDTLDDRIANLARVSNETCDKFKPACEGI